MLYYSNDQRTVHDNIGSLQYLFESSLISYQHMSTYNEKQNMFQIINFTFFNIKLN